MQCGGSGGPGGMPLSGTGGRLGGGGTPRTAPPQGGPSTSVGVELASGRARVFVHKRPEEQHWLLQCRWALHTGGPGCGRRGSSRFCLHIRCGCFASPLHHHVPAITALSSARTAAPLHGMLKKKKNEKKKGGWQKSLRHLLASLVKQGQDKGNSQAE